MATEPSSISFNLHFDTNAEQFGPAVSEEDGRTFVQGTAVAELLRSIADRIADQHVVLAGSHARILDANGNSIGAWWA